MLTKERLLILLKGYAMGMADIVPGVSGGTVALVTGIYDELISSISSVNKKFLSLVLHLKIKQAFEHVNGHFLLPLFIGILTAIILMSRLMHFFMNEYALYTWSIFFGLILASIIYVARTIESFFQVKNIIIVVMGACFGYMVVTAIPVHTANSTLMIFASGAIAICAMILPGISGSFILLILGKYLFITSALKNPFVMNNIITIGVFCGGCLVGLLTFSKILNYLLKNYHRVMMAILTGFMIGSLRKIWPWREVVEQKIIRGKVHILQDAIYFPNAMTTQEIIAFVFMFSGVGLVFLIEKISHHRRGVSSAG
ncbi:MAG: DUF368 domain-containing protein [Bacteriovoracaceae bacterium]|nr:DUF368 domain-containing protein [Halobacteriovoraceae bacterium]MDP7319773.1 DUF368 domain-containing protein [Bacteriovoracaceae bacterium]